MLICSQNLNLAENARNNGANGWSVTTVEHIVTIVIQISAPVRDESVVALSKSAVKPR
jgi:hypothetical protein